MLIPKNFLQNKLNCVLLKNQECRVRKVIIGNGYMTYPYKIGVDRCIGSCNDKDNPCFKGFLLDSILKY